jgi:NAD(P)-dependent dehydrogenase (short-subunit alcohol dehydrogenase family)
MSRAAVPAILAGGGGSLVHISSDSARLPEIGNLHYAAAKLPLLALSTSLATEFSPRGHPLERRGSRTHPHPRCTTGRVASASRPPRGGE